MDINNVETLNALALLENNEVIVELGKINGTNINISIKKYLSMYEFNKFVEEIAHSQFTDNNDFKPQFNSIVFDVALCEYYTNLNLPNEIEKAYELVQRLNLKRKILDVIEHTTQYIDLINCIQEAHSFVRSERTGLNGLFSALKNAISDFDMKEILEMLKDFDLEKLEHLSEIKELATIFSSPQTKTNSAEKLPSSDSNV